MITCTKTFPSVPFAHRAPKHDGHCKLVHGHNWTVSVTFAAMQPDPNGFVIDFGKLATLKKCMAQFDHALMINATDPELPFFKTQDGKLWTLRVVGDCSCEGIAGMFFRLFSQVIAEESLGRAWIESVTVFEDEKNSATWSNRKS